MTGTLPDCMMPDGAEPCRGYREAQAEIAEWNEIAGMVAEAIGAEELPKESRRKPLPSSAIPPMNFDNAIRKIKRERDEAQAEIARLHALIRAHYPAVPPSEWAPETARRQREADEAVRRNHNGLRMSDVHGCTFGYPTSLWRPLTDEQIIAESMRDHRAEAEALAAVHKSTVRALHGIIRAREEEIERLRTELDAATAGDRVLQAAPPSAYRRGIEAAAQVEAECRALREQMEAVRAQSVLVHEQNKGLRLRGIETIIADDALMEIVTRAHYNHHVGSANSIWEPLTPDTKAYLIDRMRHALRAIAKATPLATGEATDG